ncbi:MAG: hypothetical protein K2G89_10040 [Lachnospiraceae bacterium]|nr:hypothetical protein [Lachnospiraceae bacterium]
MNRLVRAEWYRLTHWKVLVRWMVIVFVVSISMVIFLYGEENIYAMPLSDFLTCTIDTYIMPFFMFFPAYISVAIGMSYQYKTAYYEVMAGSRISHIVGSKIMVYAGSMTVLITLVYSGIFAFWGVKNGTGDLSRIPLRLVLFLVLVLHICAVAVLMTTAVRHMVAVVMLILYFNVIQGAIMIVINLLCDTSSAFYYRLCSWIPIAQLQLIGEAQHSAYVDTYLLFAMIASMILDMGFWYAVSYIGMKKRLYR